jgi:hypothetical protein
MGLSFGLTSGLTRPLKGKAFGGSSGGGGGGGGLSLDFTSGMPAGVTVNSTPAGYAPASASTLTAFAANAGRRTALGLLIEPARTNLFTYSNDVGNWTAFTSGSGALSRATNTITAPDGSTTADQITINRSSGFDWAKYAQASFSASATTTYTWSIWLKATGANIGRTVPLALYNGTDYPVTNVTLTGTWTRYTVARTTVGAVSLETIIGYMNGDGAGIGATQFEVWGSQIEASSTITSNIDTTTASATRTADDVSFTIPSGISSLLYTFDNDTTQSVSVSPGAYTIPTNLNRAQIKTIVGS